MIKVVVIMEAQGFWDTVEPLEGMDVDMKKDKTARAYLLQTLLENLLLQVAKKKTTTEVRNYLKTRFVGANCIKATWL